MKLTVARKVMHTKLNSIVAVVIMLIALLINIGFMYYYMNQGTFKNTIKADSLNVTVSPIPNTGPISSSSIKNSGDPNILIYTYSTSIANYNPPFDPGNLYTSSLKVMFSYPSHFTVIKADGVSGFFVYKDQNDYLRVETSMPITPSITTSSLNKDAKILKLTNNTYVAKVYDSGIKAFKYLYCTDCSPDKNNGITVSTLSGLEPQYYLLNIYVYAPTDTVDTSDFDTIIQSMTTSSSTKVQTK